MISIPFPLPGSSVGSAPPVGVGTEGEVGEGGGRVGVGVLEGGVKLPNLMVLGGVGERALRLTEK